MPPLAVIIRNACKSVNSAHKAKEVNTSICTCCCYNTSENSFAGFLSSNYKLYQSLTNSEKISTEVWKSICRSLALKNHATSCSKHEILKQNCQLSSQTKEVNHPYLYVVALNTLENSFASFLNPNYKLYQTLTNSKKVSCLRY